MLREDTGSPIEHKGLAMLQVDLISGQNDFNIG